MKRETSKTLIGAFILGAVVLAVVGTLTVGSGGLFKESNRYVMYFTGSVKGLRIGAPVQLKGVTVGTVTRVNIVYLRENESFLNQVIFSIPEGAVKVIGDQLDTDSQKRRLSEDDAIDHMIKNGLRAKLGVQSFVTGQLLVAFDFYPDTPVHLMGIEDDLRELPTLPSDMEALARTLDGLDYKGLLDSILNVMSGIERLVKSPDLHAALTSANETLAGYRKLASSLDLQIAKMSSEWTATLTDIRRLANNADRRIEPLAAGLSDTAAGIGNAIDGLDRDLRPVLENLDQTVLAARTTLNEAEQLLTNLSHLSDVHSPVLYRFQEALMEIQQAAGSLRVLADFIERHPEALLQGKTNEEEPP